MERRVRHTLRTGATMVAATAAVSLLTYSGQTTDGFIHTNFSGPLSAFSGPSTSLPSDVVAIGDGSRDAAELAALLKATAPAGAGAAPLHLAIEQGSTPGSTQVSVLPTGTPVASATAATASKAALQVSSSPVLDASGKPDCRAAVSCVTDPATNATTVTLANGVVAVVQTVNDVTMVAYKSVGDILQSTVNALSLPGNGISNTIQALAPQLPVIQLPTPTTAAAVAPSAAAAVVTGPVAETPAPDAPAVIGAQTSASPTTGGGLPNLSTVNGPKVTVSRAPIDFGAPRVGNPAGTAISPINSGAVNTIKGAVDSAFNAVKDAVGKIGGGNANPAPSSDAPASGTKPSGRP